MNFDWHEKLLIWNILPYTFQLLLILRKAWSLTSQWQFCCLVWQGQECYLSVFEECRWFVGCAYTHGLWPVGCLGRVLPSTSFGLLRAGKNSLYSRRQRHSVMRFAFGCSADTPPDKYSLRKEKRKQIKKWVLSLPFKHDMYMQHSSAIKKTINSESFSITSGYCSPSWNGKQNINKIYTHVCSIFSIQTPYKCNNWIRMIWVFTHFDIH